QARRRGPVVAPPRRGAPPPPPSPPPPPPRPRPRGPPRARTPPPRAFPTLPPGFPPPRRCRRAAAAVPSTIMRLHWHPFSIIPRRVRIALAEKSIPYEDVIVDVLSGAHREPAVRQLNPPRPIPGLEDDGLVVCESIAILEYLEERFPAPALLPRETGVRATTRQFMQWSGDRQLIHAWETWMKPAFAVTEPVDGPGRDRAHDDLAAHLDI